MLRQEDLGTFLGQASQKGMFAVTEDSSTALLSEFDSSMKEAARLCCLEDDVSEPYKSKYAARTMLDGLVNKLEATRTIAAVEGKNVRMLEMDWRIACARTKLGSISWECDEPHNAQTDLELAADFYFPRFVSAVVEIVGDEQLEDEDWSASLQPERPNSLDRFEPPPVAVTSLLKEHKVNAMKCLNMLGILWAGRGQVRKAFMYLLAAKNLYGLENIENGKDTDVEGDSLQLVYTHTLFYLAQAYGKIGDTIRSSRYCYETLQRQLNMGFDGSARTALDWVKNCASIADFYKSMNHYRRCAMALASAEEVLRRHVLAVIKNADAEQAARDSANSSDFDQMTSLVTADLNIRWAAFDLLVLKRAFDRESKRRNAIELSYEPEPEEPAPADDDDMGAAAAATEAALAKLEAGEQGTPSSVFSISEIGGGEGRREFFKSLAVSSVPFIGVGEVTTFERARAIFLRGASRIEAARKFYQLDGYVTDHANLLYDNSRFYHYLAIFEPDVKRKMAMENRRVDLLQPLIAQLNKAAYEVLHKQLSFEIGEAHMSLLEIKMDKLKNDLVATHGHRIALSERNMKRTDITKCNTYALGALASLTHYLSFFAKSTDRNARGGSKPFLEMSFLELFAVSFADPDDSLISEEELRSFLNAHFYCCRVLSKIINPPEAPPHERALPLATCLQRYEWLQKKGATICSQKGVNMDDIFLNERQIIEEMIKLLPSKIDRIYYQGESSIL